MSCIRRLGIKLKPLRNSTSVRSGLWCNQDQIHIERCHIDFQMKSQGGVARRLLFSIRNVALVTPSQLVEDTISIGLSYCLDWESFRGPVERRAVILVQTNGELSPGPAEMSSSICSRNAGVPWNCWRMTTRVKKLRQGDIGSCWITFLVRFLGHLNV